MTKAKPTNRKFYGKWLYKVSLDLNGGAIFRDTPVDEVIMFCNDTKSVYTDYSYRRRASANREKIKEVAVFLKGFSSDLWSTRIESDQVDFYTNDKAFYTALSETFDSIVFHKFEPAEGTLEQLNDAHTIVVNKLPHNRFNYRVYLQPHKLAGRKEEKEQFVSWLKNHPRVTCSAAIEEWFIKTEWNWDRRYILVEDEPTLLMLKLRSSESVGRIYKFVLGDK